MIVSGLFGALIAAVITVIALNMTTGERQVDRKLEHRYAIDDPQFRRELGTLLGPPIIDGNQVTNLENGVEIFPAMLQAVRAARHNVNFETYIYWSGDVGRQFGAQRRKRRGILAAVHDGDGYAALRQKTRNRQAGLAQSDHQCSACRIKHIHHQ